MGWSLLSQELLFSKGNAELQTHRYRCDVGSNGRLKGLAVAPMPKGALHRETLDADHQRGTLMA